MAELKAYNPTLRDRFAWALGDAVGILGGGNQAQRTASNKARGILDFLPVVGDAVSFDDARVNYNQGNYGQAAADAGLGILGSVPGAGDAAVLGGKGLLAAMGAGVAKKGILDEATKGIRAYHGSPHSFDKFRLDKIGTGEGAQAYGHGLYFAENEGVARDYRNKLAMGQATIDGRPMSDLASEKYKLAYNQAPTIEHNIADIVSSYGDQARNVMEARYPDLLKSYDELVGAGRIKEPGHMYEVNINADPDAFLDWDKPLSEQPNGARESLLGLLPPAGSNSYADNNYLAAPTKDGGYEYKADVGRMVQELSRGGGSALRDTMLKAGIPGIKYLDRGSRGAGEGSRNYVVFDENLISIVKKYGLAGAVSAGLISQQMADQMQAQGEI